MVKTDKDFYDRKIVYLDYRERGEKVKNGGFVKWEARGETSRIQIHIRGLYSTDTLRGEIQLISRKTVYAADSIKIDFGSGEYVAVWKNENLAGTAISYEECDGVQVKLSESRMLIGQWREREAAQESKITEIENGKEETAEIGGGMTENTEITVVSETLAEEEKEAAEQENMPEGGESESESAPEVHAGEKGEKPEQGRVWEEPAETKDGEPEQGSVWEESAETKGGELEQGSVWEEPAETKDGEPEQGSVWEESAETKDGEQKQGSASEEPAKAEVEELRQGSAWEAPVKTGGGEPEREGTSEVRVKEEKEPERESALEISMEREEKEPEKKGAPQALMGMKTGETEKRAAEPENAAKVPARAGVKEAKKESMPEVLVKAEGKTAEREYAAEKLAEMNRGESRGGNRKTAQNPQCRALLSGDKWEQLNKQYPHIHPFGDAREYLSITPRDFIILSRKYQELVQNSFLLHGYYNYGHVILTKIKEKDGERFYLGVPGVYYTREKQAALMFGFEGFEAGTEQAVDGGFGYYMKQVDI